MIFAIIGSVGMFILPDTPRWYYAKGYINKGDAVLCCLFDADIDDPAVQNTKQDIISNIKLEEDNKSDFNILDLIWDRSYLRAGRRIRISFMILALQQMMGKCIFIGIIQELTANRDHSRHQPIRVLQHCHLCTSRLIAFPYEAISSNHEHPLCCWNCTTRLHY